MDRIHLKTEKVDTPACGPTDAVGIFINNRDLVDLARGVEGPSAAREGKKGLAGDYLGVPAGSVFRPSRRFLGEPDWHLDGGYGRISVLGCTCGDVGCWPLQARITVRESTVVWDDFVQPHRRGWDHSGLGPFTFDRGAYEAELRGASASRM